MARCFWECSCFFHVSASTMRQMISGGRFWHATLQGVLCLSVSEKGHRKLLVKIKNNRLHEWLAVVFFCRHKKPYLKLVNMHYSCFVEYEKCVLHVQRDPLTNNIVGLWCEIVNQFTLRPWGLKGHKPLPCNRPQLCTVRCFIFET